jgi:hypothetical protein
MGGVHTKHTPYKEVCWYILIICDAIQVHHFSFAVMGLLPAHREGYGFSQQEEVDQREAELVEVRPYLKVMVDFSIAGGPSSPSMKLIISR